jgi:hypothetical protein
MFYLRSAPRGRQISRLVVKSLDLTTETEFRYNDGPWVASNPRDHEHVHAETFTRGLLVWKGLMVSIWTSDRVDGTCTVLGPT